MARGILCLLGFINRFVNVGSRLLLLLRLLRLLLLLLLLLHLLLLLLNLRGDRRRG